MKLLYFTALCVSICAIVASIAATPTVERVDLNSINKTITNAVLHFKETQDPSALETATTAALSVNTLRIDSPDLERALVLRLRLLRVIHEAYETFPRTEGDSGPVTQVMPLVTPEQPDVYAGMDPAAIRDPRVRAAYKQDIAENELKALHSKREQQLKRLLAAEELRVVVFIEVKFGTSSMTPRAIATIHDTLPEHPLEQRLEQMLRERSHVKVPPKTS